MTKLKFFIPFLALAVLILVGAGCGKNETAEEPLTDVLSKAKNITTYSYDAVITSPGEPAAITKFWLKGDKMRWEGSYNEQENVVYLIDKSEETAYYYMTGQKIAMKMDFGEVDEVVGESVSEQSEYIENYNPATMGTEIIDGKNCLVVEYGEEPNRIKTWIWKEYGIPIRTETNTDQGVIVFEIKNIEFNDIPDSLFELPADVQVTSMSDFDF